MMKQPLVKWLVDCPRAY